MVKYLVLLLVVVLVLWWAGRPRVARSAGNTSRGGASAAGRQVRPMVACAHCGVHLPQDEALSGPGGHYCCEAHRAAHR
ncbi:PP0621 family protein [Caldimonas thermodepolymerans]|jgi:hypothetical protein|uniref:Deaminase n=1 Tax=Caldimonas thermodepolymerans TaxID=215580 RepID=A0AA46DH28_9BURK|nr:PP0621 family protein [Caldimonas thermodepolymerans]RDH97035.1 uncharacterized protein DES46_10953 [Caldimonas thermodepolymerans]TCP09062.1 uncharacterized protein EV676_102575 [Caldimonas thermodepolymerans]UZG43693.1 PP0621 family protein [Caldimonas thermodepolymerans]